MHDINVILDFSPESKKLLSDFIAALHGNQPITEPDAAPVETPATTPEPAKPARVVTNDDVLKMVTDLIRAGKKDAARSIVTAYAPGVSTIPADKCAEVMEKLEALAAGK